jgi:hypothetical protein
VTSMRELSLTLKVGRILVGGFLSSELSSVSESDAFEAADDGAPENGAPAGGGPVEEPPACAMFD